jgi:hypothetical protein
MRWSDAVVSSLSHETICVWGGSDAHFIAKMSNETACVEMALMLKLSTHLIKDVSKTSCTWDAFDAIVNSPG